MGDVDVVVGVVNLVDPRRHGRKHTEEKLSGVQKTPPPTVACKMEAQSEYVHVAYTFLHVWCRFYVLSRCLPTKFQHRSSAGSLSGVRCWLGTKSNVQQLLLRHPSNCLNTERQKDARRRKGLKLQEVKKKSSSKFREFKEKMCCR